MRPHIQRIKAITGIYLASISLTVLVKLFFN